MHYMYRNALGMQEYQAEVTLEAVAWAFMRLTS